MRLPTVFFTILNFAALPEGEKLEPAAPDKRHVRGAIHTVILILFLLSGMTYQCQAQSWSAIMSSVRGIDWTHSGLPTSSYAGGSSFTWPDGEVASNPWTPPARTQCGSTLTPLGSGQDDAPQIVTALSNCSAAHFVLLGPGTFTINSQIRMTPAYMGNNNYVTLAGSGAQNTILKITYSNSGAPAIGIGNEVTSTTDTITNTSSNFAQGNTSIVVSGSQPPTNAVGILAQCDTFLSSNPCAPTSSEADNGGLWFCDFFTVCANQTASGGPGNSEQQRVYITAVSGSGSTWTVTFTPGLYLPNWGTNVNVTGTGGASFPTPTLTWTNASYEAMGDGIQDLTIDLTAGDSYVSPSGTWASWMKGIRFVGPGGGSCCPINASDNESFLFANNYFFGANSSGAGPGLIWNHSNDSMVLRLNNIWMASGNINLTEATGLDEGDVNAYEYGRDANTTQVYNCDAEHAGGTAYLLREGEEFGCSEDDFTWGAKNLNTWFRNNISGYDGPYLGEAAPRGIVPDNEMRFENAVGNVIGASGELTSYSTSSAISPYIFGCNGSTCSTLSIPTQLRWGNYSYGCSGDSHCNAATFNSSDNPSSIASPNGALDNLASPSTSLPCSFFLAGYTSTTCTAHANGGTGLSWWKVCTNFNPSAGTCGGSTTTTPFPPVGPDVTGGQYANGYAYDIPSAIAWKTLPVDSNYQVSYTVSASSYSSGTETLTLSGFPTGQAVMGGFQVSGMNTACYPSSGVSYTGRSDNEMLMTNATSTEVQYALASNPGVSCTGTLKWPDVREFDERVYEADPAGTYTITISSTSGGSAVGTVTSSDSVLNCTVQGLTGTCTDSTASGTVTLTFTAASGYSLSSVTGCTLSGNTCSVTGTATITATFTANPTGVATTPGVLLSF